MQRAILTSFLLISAFVAGYVTSTAQAPERREVPEETSDASLLELREQLEAVQASVEALHATAFAATVQAAAAPAGCETPQRAAPVVVAEQAPERSPEQKLASDRTLRRVEEAIAAGRWTEEDAEVLKSGERDLTDQQRSQLFGKLFAAMNRGEVVAEGPVF